MKDANRDPYDIKKFDEVLGESRMMVPDSTRRLAAAVEDLQAYLAENNSTFTDNEWMGIATDILEKEKELLSNEEGGIATNVDDLAEGEAFWKGNKIPASMFWVLSEPWKFTDGKELKEVGVLFTIRSNFCVIVEWPIIMDLIGECHWYNIHDTGQENWA